MPANTSEVGSVSCITVHRIKCIAEMCGLQIPPLVEWSVYQFFYNPQKVVEFRYIKNTGIGLYNRRTKLKCLVLHTGWCRKKWDIYTLCKHLLGHGFICVRLGSIENSDWISVAVWQFRWHLKFLWCHSWRVWQTHWRVWQEFSFLHCTLTNDRVCDKWRANFVI